MSQSEEIRKVRKVIKNPLSVQPESEVSLSQIVFQIQKRKNRPLNYVTCVFLEHSDRKYARL